MEKKKMPGISQCMIVKNEEQNIERALSWGKGIVSEQIIVDTGSTDRTVEIARRMGAKIYEFSWIDDFSAAKNYAISKAEHEWIAFLDADEYFPPEDAGKLLSCIDRLCSAEADGIKTVFVNLDKDGKPMDIRSHLRVFRNLPNLRYHGRIHEYLKKDGDGNIRTVDMTKDLSIYHTGYGTTERKKSQKNYRNLDLLLVELNDRPDDYEILGYLGIQYESMGKLKEAETAYRKSVSLMPKEMEGQYGVTTSEIWRHLLNVLTLIPGKSESEILEIYHQAKEGWPEDGDYDYILGKYYGFHGDYRLGEKYLRQALNLLCQHGCGDKSVRLSGNIIKAYEELAMCCFNNGNLEECVKMTAMILKENPYLMSTLMVMLSALLKDPGTGGKGRNGTMEVVSFLSNHFYQLQSLKDRLFILRGAMAVNYQDLTEVLKETFTPEELSAVNQTMKESFKTESEHC